MDSEKLEGLIQAVLQTRREHGAAMKVERLAQTHTDSKLASYTIANKALWDYINELTEAKKLEEA